ncbi:SusC/RagA family TonB-linked outer membrane protein [Dysgonomonas reticulitermitis]
MSRKRKLKIGRRLISVFFFSFVFTIATMGQSVQVTGVVVEKSTGEPIVGASVTHKETKGATMTDIDGGFTLKADINSTLEVRFIGYQPYILKVENAGPYRIELKDDNQNLDEVVVVGYGTQKKVNLTGAVSSVKMGEEIYSRTITNVSSALSGLVPGLSTQQTSGMAGSNNSKLLIRGLGTVNNADPLIVVDGMPDVDINRIDMHDIESISVLKDASSAAVYGSRAANGVILITTKTGKGSGKLSIDYTGSVAFANPIKFYDSMTNYPKNLTMHQWAAYAGRTTSSFGDGTIDEWLSMSMIDPIRFPNTDQMDWVTRQAMVQSHNISASGSTDKTNFYLSVGYLDEAGYMINNDNTRYNFRMNFDYKIRKNVRVGARMDGQWNNQTYPHDQGLLSYNGADMILSMAIPGLLPYNYETGQYGGYMAEGEPTNIYNLYANYTVYHNLKERQEFNGNVFGEWDIIKGLTARLDFGLRYYNQFIKSYSGYPGMSLYNFQTGNPTNVFIEQSAGVTDALNQGYKKLTQASLRYDKTFGERHKVAALFSYNEEYWFNRTMGAGRNDRIHPSIVEVNGALDRTQLTRGTSDEEALRSYVGRANYSFRDRYLAEVNFRVDGSSKFLPGHQYGFFPSGSLGWRFTEEEFLEPLKKYISSGKLRFSLGTLGNNSGVGKYEQKETLATTNYPLNGNNLVTGFSVNKMINKDFTWEKTRVSNLGIDLGFFNNKLAMEIDLYDRLTTGMIRPSNLSTILTGYSAPRVNMGNLRNRGIEVNTRWMSSINKFNYGASFNFSYNRDRLEKWNEPLNAGNVYIDMPYEFVYTMLSTGIAQSWEDIYNAPYHGNNNMSPGDLLYADLNGDGQITAADKKAYPALNMNRPTANYGLNLYAAWKGFDINMLFQGTTGRKSYWMNRMNTVYVGANRYAFQEWHWNDTWNLTNRDAWLPRMVSGNTPRSMEQSSFWLESMDYMRMKNLQVGYTFPKKFINRMGLEKIRLYFSAENLFTVTGWDGVDPEKATVSGIGEDPYPIMKTFSIGVNIGI